MSSEEKFALFITSIQQLNHDLSLLAESQAAMEFSLPKIDYDRIEVQLYELIQDLNRQPQAIKEKVEPYLGQLRKTVERGHKILLTHIQQSNEDLEFAKKQKKAIQAYGQFSSSMKV